VLDGWARSDAGEGKAWESKPIQIDALGEVLGNYEALISFPRLVAEFETCSKVSYELQTSSKSRRIGGLILHI
jgi:hypothetical protein